MTSTATTLTRAYNLQLISLPELRILRVLASFLVTEVNEVFPSLETISRKLRQFFKLTRGAAVRTIRHHLASLERRFGIPLRLPDTDSARAARHEDAPPDWFVSARQTSNRYALRELLRVIEVRLEHLVAARSSAAPVADGVAAPIAALEERSIPKREPEIDQILPTNNQLPSDRDTDVDSKASNASAFSEEASLRAVALSWGLAKKILDRFAGRLGQAVRYVQNRQHLAASCPDQIPPIANPGGYLHALLRNPDADLSLRPLPKVEKELRRRATMNPPRIEVSQGFDAARIRASLAEIEAEVRSSAIGEHPKLEGEVRAVRGLAVALSDAPSPDEVQRLEEELQGVDGRIYAILEGTSKEWKAEAISEATRAQTTAHDEASLRKAIEIRLRRRAALPKFSDLFLR